MAVRQRAARDASRSNRRVKSDGAAYASAVQAQLLKFRSNLDIQTGEKLAGITYLLQGNDLQRRPI